MKPSRFKMPEPAKVIRRHDQFHHCPVCGMERVYSYAYDAFYCRKCVKWLHPRCDDINCIYCEGRPAVPPSA